MKISYILLPSSVVVNFDGKTFNINNNDSRYAQIIKAIKENKLSDIPDLVDLEKRFNGEQGILLKDGLLYIDGTPLPEGLSSRVLAFQREGLPYSNLLKFARKLQLNPSFNSRQQLYKFLEHNGHPITTEGNFIAYRGVTNDFKDCHTRTFDNSVGSICEVKREQVDDNPNNTCSNGLHVACFDYANGFGPVTVEVEVDPRDVVAVPTDYNGTKMRVCKFKVVGVVQNMNTKTLVESSYNGDTELDEKDYSWDIDDCCVDDYLEDDCEVEDDPVHRVQLRYSTAIDGADWFPSDLSLYVYFRDGKTYKYTGVPRSEVLAWENATSAGKYFMDNIAHSYPYIKL